MKYTLETLIEKNTSRSYVDESIVTKVNTLVDEIENDRNSSLPTYGDIVKYTDKYGSHYGKASVQPAHNGFTKDGQINLCQSGGHSFYYNHSCDTSGGPWTNIDRKHFKLIGKATASFWTWGYMGACGNGGVDFNASVNLWECNLNEQAYSTEFYNRQFIHDNGKPDESGYRWFGQGIAFRTLEDYQAWLKTFNAIEIKKSTGAEVWHDKEQKHYVSLAEYNAIKNAVLDTTLCNGVRECKRVYSKHKVDTYVTYDIPELDWRTNKEYARARQEAE